MKNILIIICLVFLGSYCFGQKMLTQVNLKSELLKEIDRSSLADIQTSLNKRQKTAGFPVSLQLISNERVKVYRVKESEDLVQIMSITREDELNNWDKKVRISIEMYASTDGQMERYVENINGKDFEAVSFFTKGNYRGKNNYALYRSKAKEIALFITYITHSPDDVRIENMRKIIKDIKIE
ncbi:hypothetical protein G5B00_17780 [Parapedobacter sp. SGR-10]|uniref:hypothetical protein n=1 Tax=Parapedobacter sp. SGR-10 TaxID=2710879 RepID=UPI0013D3DED1|nr:hypothetical protein [Parapedobacter sp. SGR-10]NGF58350.1 hypothetical protein [Parapedobacter sp. SGR-10]